MPKWTTAELNVVKNKASRGLEVVWNSLPKSSTHTVEAVGRKIRRTKLDLKLARDLRVGYLDIECTNLKAPFGTILSWAIYDAKNDKLYFATITRSDILNYRGDKDVVRKCLEALKNFDHIITYYGGFAKQRMDLPFLLTKAIHYNLPFPHYGDMTQTDLYNVCKQRLSLQNYKQATVCAYFNIRGKTPINFDYWNRAAVGDEKAIHQVWKHNIGDVKTLARLAQKLERYHANIRNVM